MAHRTAVIGGGISGLASAWRIAGLGHDVTLIESEPQLGGLGGTFSTGSACLERFYHCILPSDRALLSLIHALGLDDELIWKNCGLGFLHQGSLYPLNGALDLLKFSPLTWTERVRTGLLGIRAKIGGLSPLLDQVTAETWLRGAVGDRAFEILWKPLLSAKIGDEYVGLPALYLSARLNREKSTAPEVKGCLAGGYRALIDALERGLIERGVQVRLSTSVTRIESRGRRGFDDHGEGLLLTSSGGTSPVGETGAEAGTSEPFDTVVATAPLPHFRAISAGIPLPAIAPAASLDYQGVVSGLFLLDRPLSPFYWMPFVDCGATAQGVVEMTNLIPLDRTGGRHVVYLMNYTHRSSEFYARGDDEILDLYERDIANLFPGAAGAVRGRYLFRAPFVEPIWKLGATAIKPPASLIPGRLYLVSTAQLYPRVNSWNSCCEIVEEMLPAYAAETGAPAPGPLAGAPDPHRAADAAGARA